MKIEEFWNQAFLAALTRLPADEAQQEATKATGLCIDYWKIAQKHRVHPLLTAWKDQNVDSPDATSKFISGSA